MEPEEARVDVRQGGDKRIAAGDMSELVGEHRSNVNVCPSAPVHG
jgi:hypothetical protein